MLSSTVLDLHQDPQAPRISIDGHDVTQEIRTPEVSQMASVVSAIPLVREWLLPVQRTLAGHERAVVEGRDIGTTVFPNAPVKFFLDASSEVRAARRQRELIAAGHTASFDRTRTEMESRDRHDRSRPIAPLAVAPDATVIDTSSLTVDEVVERMLAVVASKL